MRASRPIVVTTVLVLCAGFSSFGAAAARGTSPRVLRVGTWRGISGTFTSVQVAVRSARPGDWVLVGPGDYKENGFAGMDEPAGVLITTANLHLRGMNRNTVVVDGTKPGSARCSAKQADQIVTTKGRNGVMAHEIDGVSIENLTVCNYLTGSGGGEGNEIWWNGGDGSGQIHMGPFRGDYLTATSTYSNGTQDPRGEYGIFTSNSRGPGVIDHSYASNMGDAAYYIGACPNCNQILNHAHGSNSALGYSGTNSGGNLVVENSEFDRNLSGLVSNSQNNDDLPSPQIGLCPGGADGPLGLGICTIFRNNYLHDNNNPNVPGAGSGGLAGGAPVGTGLVLAGSHYLAVVHNRIANNGSWGVVVTDLPDQETPPSGVGQPCQGGTNVPVPPGQEPLCYYDVFGNAVMDNTFTHNGYFGNPTNGDIALAAKGALNTSAGNCFAGNSNTGGTLTSDPLAVQSNPLYSPCPAPHNANPEPALLGELLCATQLVADCPTAPGATYPRTTGVSLHMPAAQTTMPNPCAGVPTNPWCPAAATGAVSSPSLATTGMRALLPLLALAILTAGGVGMRRISR
ncbi:MAG: hypothetical protein QOG53_1566 [Frankiales bacterium]|jgi:hypothetical protein|nr:hypothetical protein [Frankiales bacterium]